MFFREIGNYNNCGKWSKSFHQSEVALKKLKISKQLKGHQSSIATLHFHSKGRLMVSGSLDNEIRIWDWSRGRSLMGIRYVHTSGIFQVIYFMTLTELERLLKTGSQMSFLMQEYV